MSKKKKEKIVGFHITGTRWRVVDKAQYKKSFTHEVAVQYLWNEIYESVDREMTHILSGKKTGFYSGLRFLFAELTYLSHLYWGKKACHSPNESRYVARFMRKFNILAPEYGVHYDVFRHGLMHTHHPKWIKKNNKIIPWSVSNASKMTDFGVAIPEFSYQIKKAIKKFWVELKVEGVTSKRTRLDNFFEGFSDATKILTRKDIAKYAKKDFSNVKIPS